jgi:hypothetical protein
LSTCGSRILVEWKQNPISSIAFRDLEYLEVSFYPLSNPEQPENRNVSSKKPEQLTSKSGVARANQTFPHLA